MRPAAGQRAAYIAQATDADGRYDDAVGVTVRVGLKAGTRRLAVRVTDESGACTWGTRAVRVGR